jgi:hypothetical protein
MTSTIHGSSDNVAQETFERKETLDFREFKLEKCVKAFPWLYHHPVEKGYKCKTCELFPPLGTTSGQSRLKFGQEAVKNLTGHPTRYLRGHEKSHKHQNAITQYEGISNNNLLHFSSRK